MYFKNIISKYLTVSYNDLASIYYNFLNIFKINS